jgi:hypothetical protein
MTSPLDATSLETARLLLRRWQSQDLDGFAALNAQPEVMRYIHDGRILDRAATAERLTTYQRHWDEHVGRVTLSAAEPARHPGAVPAVVVALDPGYGLRLNGRYPDLALRLPAQQAYDRLVVLAESVGTAGPRDDFICGAAGVWKLRTGRSELLLECLNDETDRPVLIRALVSRRTRRAGTPELCITYAGIDLLAEAADDIAWLLRGLGETVEDQPTGIRLPTPGIAMAKGSGYTRPDPGPSDRYTTVEIVDPVLFDLSQRRSPT